MDEKCTHMLRLGHMRWTTCFRTRLFTSVNEFIKTRYSSQPSPISSELWSALVMVCTAKTKARNGIGNGIGNGQWTTTHNRNNSLKRRHIYWPKII